MVTPSPRRTSGSPPSVAISFVDVAPAEVATDALVLPIPSGDPEWGGLLAAVDAALDGALRQVLAESRFADKIGSVHVVPTLGRLPARRLVATRLPADVSRAEDVRRAYGAAASAARSAGARELAVVPPAGSLDDRARARAMVEGTLLALYTFTDHKSRHDQDNGNGGQSIERIALLAPASDGANQGLAEGLALAAGVYLARDLVNEPGSVIFPETLAALARQLAREQELEYQEFDERQLVEMGATAIYDVGKGSAHPPRLIHLTYRPTGESKGTVALVGKGITFDTGGMNLKPTGGIETMKSDMAGGAAVIGAMRAIAKLDLPFTVHGIVAAAENMPSDTAFRPGDVVRALNGKTIEIMSTDAEGRLVLADALVYAARNGAEELIDLATLTGAKIIALGSESVAVFSNDDAFARRVVDAGTEAGELFWHMPLWDDLKRQIKSDIADMKNTGGRPGGAITAALLLAEFSEGRPWVHLDIAGAALAESARNYTPKGATGVGVRALVNYLEAKARE